MKILVTGAAGFIGSHLCERLLDEEHDVIGIDAFTDYYNPEIKRRNLVVALRHPRYRFIEGDLAGINVAGLLDGVDIVYHLAAQAGVRASWGDEFSIYTTTNILLTQRLLEAARGAHLSRFVYASSSSVYGNAARVPMSEDDPCRPFSPYGVSKLAGEHLAMLYCHNFQVPATALRFFTVYGPRQRPDMAFHKFLKAIYHDQPIDLYGDGEQTRDFTFIKDIVEATMTAGFRAPAGMVFNIGGGHRVSMNDVIELLGEVTGRPVKVNRAAEQHGDMKHTYADIERARSLLGYAPKFDLERGLRLEWEWLQQAITRGVL